MTVSTTREGLLQGHPHRAPPLSLVPRHDERERRCCKPHCSLKKITESRINATLSDLRSQFVWGNRDGTRYSFSIGRREHEGALYFPRRVAGQWRRRRMRYSRSPYTAALHPTLPGIVRRRRSGPLFLLNGGKTRGPPKTRIDTKIHPFPPSRPPRRVNLRRASRTPFPGSRGHPRSEPRLEAWPTYAIR